jgi:hypothetical protein
MFGYKLVGGKCLLATCAGSVGHCYACGVSSLECSVCQAGYSLGNGSLCAFSSCPDGFVFDQLSSGCVCSVGTYQAGSSCLPCADSRCQNCTAALCFSCAEEYYPLLGTCLPCMVNCLSCLSGSSC